MVLRDILVDCAGSRKNIGKFADHQMGDRANNSSRVCSEAPLPTALYAISIIYMPQ
ncbi:hypothetical protein KIN20_033940 [Parelaphostrongylus tenuis]|uniref:Uncharacterized protein n=1 Tax=Parelaphostrongylus tenuis TaxID=148309 RepID=A0AAD5R8W3_PARTN|nr:hypothetical protein KIN20_033940 [Parelaphostrongylus tenuis]